MGEIAEAGHQIRALNDGLTVLDFEKEPETETEPEEEEVRSKKAPAKKAPTKAAPSKAAKPAPIPEVAEEEGEEEVEEGEEEVEEVEVTREDLEAMDLAELKQLAKDNGIELPPRTRSTTYIDAILGVDDTPTAEVEDVAASNGHVAVDVDLEALAPMVADILISRLKAVLAEV
jgi:hypothetical protein